MSGIQNSFFSSSNSIPTISFFFAPEKGTSQVTMGGASGMVIAHCLGNHVYKIYPAKEHHVATYRHPSLEPAAAHADRQHRGTGRRARPCGAGQACSA